MVSLCKRHRRSIVTPLRQFKLVVPKRGVI
jgi:hypothetical protein